MASKSSNRAEVPEAKEALDRFKMEVANELGVPLSNGYNGNLTSAQNGSVGGYMVKKMIEAQEMHMAGMYGLTFCLFFCYNQTGGGIPGLNAPVFLYFL